MLISHPQEKNVPEKSLQEHLLNVAKLSQQQIQDMDLDLTIIDKQKIARLSFLIGLFHDFGKCTSFFQSYIRKNRNGDPLTQHSFLSALVAYHLVCEQEFEAAWGIAAFLIIKRHHGNLETLSDNEENNLQIAKIQIDDILNKQAEAVNTLYTNIGIEHVLSLLKDFDINKFEQVIDEFEDCLDEFRDCLEEEQQIEFFFIVNLLFSVLIDNDKKDAARLQMEYFQGNLEEPINDVHPYIKHCQTNDPEKFNPKRPLNQLRNQFIEEIVNNNNICPQNHFYTITAPTGIGKTFGCLAFANKLKEQLPKGQGRIIYCLPYTSIIDQNHAEFEKIIQFSKKQEYDQRPQRYLLKHHHLTFKALKNRKNEEEYEFKDYLDDRLFVESWESAFIVTTFVQFFHTIIGHTNRFLKKLHNVVNSIVILDEVQNIPPEYHYLLKKVLYVLGQRFNIYFLLISATQPEILKYQDSKPISLVNAPKYMKASIFNRVELDVEKTNLCLDDFGDEFCRNFSGQNCLIVLNTKKSAIKLYNLIKAKRQDYQVFCLTTLLVPQDRKARIAEIQALKGEKVIVVSTQLIEAGVDLSFQYVYRDFGPLDSVIQVAGRCNRNNEYAELGGKMRLLKLVNEDQGNRAFHGYVYKPVLTYYTQSVLESDSYESKDFTDLSSAYFAKFEFKDKAQQLLEAISELNYDQTGLKGQIPIKDFKLIDEYSTETLYVLNQKHAQEKFDHYLDLKILIQDKQLSSQEREDKLLQIEKIKGQLKAFQLNLRPSELLAYKDSFIIEQKENIKYISYENQKEFAYSPEVGFLTEPKAQVSSTLAF